MTADELPAALQRPDVVLLSVQSSLEIAAPDS